MFRVRTLTLLALAGLLLTACASGGSEIAVGEPLVDIPDLPKIELSTPTADAGLKPHFEWTPVEEAAYYLLIVHDRNGEPYWSWIGTQTSVYLGGGDTPPPDDSAGPILSTAMTWGVMAFDENDILIAASLRRSISP